jgi:nucleoside-diphosphate-sugar epimerase
MRKLLQKTTRELKCWNLAGRFSIIQNKNSHTKLEDFVSRKQLIIYGANGWLGRSALSAATSGSLANTFDDILLIGSKESVLELDHSTYHIHSSHGALEHIRNGAVFFNSAFLRREYLQNISETEYIYRNNEISKFALKILNEFNLASFINISSGVANSKALYDVYSDPYAQLKRHWEHRFEESSSNCGNAFLNCRIFSLTGRYINEFDNLAISAFIKSSLSGSAIYVKSPRTLRTYIDAEQISHVLLNLGQQEISLTLDSGGVLVSMEELAETVLEVVGLGFLEITQIDTGSDYFGNFAEFNSLADSMGVEVLSLRRQIEKTLPAFLKFTEN